MASLSQGGGASSCHMASSCHVGLFTFSMAMLSALFHCLPKGRHSEAAREKRLLCAQKCTRGWGGVGWGGGGVGYGGVGWGMVGWGGVGHVGVGWGGS